MRLYFPLTMEFQLIVLNVEVTFVIAVAAVDGGVLKKWTVPIYQITMLVTRVIS